MAAGGPSSRWANEHGLQGGDPEARLSSASSGKALMRSGPQLSVGRMGRWWYPLHGLAAAPTRQSVGMFPGITVPFPSDGRRTSAASLALKRMGCRAAGGGDGVRSRGDGSEAPALYREVEFAIHTLLAEET